MYTIFYFIFTFFFLFVSFLVLEIESRPLSFLSNAPLLSYIPNPFVGFELTRQLKMTVSSDLPSSTFWALELQSGHCISFYTLLMEGRACSCFSKYSSN